MQISWNIAEMCIVHCSVETECIFCFEFNQLSILKHQTQNTDDELQITICQLKSIYTYIINAYAYTSAYITTYFICFFLSDEFKYRAVTFESLELNEDGKWWTQTISANKLLVCTKNDIVWRVKLNERKQ